MLEEQEWRDKIAAAEATLAAENDEGVVMMRRHHGPALDLCQRTLAITRVLLHETRGAVPNGDWPPIVLSLFIHMMSVLRAALTLAVVGHGRELGIAIRPGLEALITMRFIAAEDQARRAQVWVDHASISKQGLAQKHPDLFSGPEREAMRREIDKRADAVADAFPRRFWASSLGCSNLRAMAQKVGLLWYFDSIYWLGSQPIHATAIAVEEVVSFPENAGPIYKVGLSGVDVHRYLGAFCDFLIQGLELLDKIMPLCIEDAVRDLRSEFIANFSDILQKDEDG